jgi:hypothetical protein
MDANITLTDGKTFQDGHVLYLVTKSGGIFYIAAKSQKHDSSVHAWQVAQSAIRYIELKPPRANPALFLDKLK